MKLIYILMALILILVACRSDNGITTNLVIEDATTIPTFTPTPSDTPFPTNTPIATPTALPPQLETIPDYNPNDVVVIAGTYVFQITGADVRSQIGENISAPEGKQFLIFDGILYNYADEDQTFFRTNFGLELADESRILPNVERMESLQNNESAYAELTFPGRSTVRLNVLTVAAKRWQTIFLVYEIPETFDEITLSFNPANINPASTIGLWVIDDAENGTYGVYKAYDNGVALYSIDFEFTNRRVQLEELIDEELIEIDNCFGNATVTRTFTFSEEISTSYNIGASVASTGVDAVGSAAGLLLGHPIIGDIISSGFTGFFDLSEGESIVITREEQLSAAPGSMTRYQLSWYRVTLQGTMQMLVGGDNFYIPYTITDRLRSDLVSLTPGICETNGD